MTADQTHRLLIIEGDAPLAETLGLHFESAGYTALVTTTARDGLDLAHSERPQLILLASRLPDGTGLDVFHDLREQPRTGHIPVMIMAGRDDASLQNTVLEAGAYDFIEKPVDLDILSLRVRNALRRAEREGLTEPRTGLPTGRLIEERLRRLETTAGWLRIELTIAEFGTFRDLYGFVTANEALRFAGNLIVEIVNEHGAADDFVGHHTNTEQFLVITRPARGSALAHVLAERVTQELASFYNFMEREQGHVLVDDGSGYQVEKPLMRAAVEVTPGPADPTNPAGDSDDPWIDARDD